MAVIRPLWQQARKILCVRLDSLGDVLMATPAMRAVKQSGRARSLTLLSSPSGAAAAPFIDELDDVISYAAPWMKSPARHRAANDNELIAQLGKRRFDGAIIFTSYSQSPLPAALMCHLAGIPLRLAHCRENPYHLLTDWLVDPEPQSLKRHEVQRQLDLASSIGCQSGATGLSFQVRETDLVSVAQRLQGFGIAPGQPWILMHPGASAPSRRYPANLWSAVINQLASRSKLPVLLSGEAHEAALIEQIRASCASATVHSLAGQLSLGELGAAIKLTRVLVCNNTGPAHMAAAIGTPVADLYALTNPQHTPWQVPSRVLFHDVPCRFCYKSDCPQGHHDCLNKLAPERVADAACSLMTSTSNWRTVRFETQKKVSKIG